MPNAARGWGKHRDNFILNHFNKDGWECHRCLSDPCLFVIDRIKPIPKQKDSSTNEKKRTSIRSWVLIHTDDCDAYGKDMDVLHEINDIMNEEWATEIVDSSFVLGVKRERGHDADGKRYCKMSMTSSSSRTSTPPSKRSTRKPSRRRKPTKLPSRRTSSKSIDPGEGEVKRNIDRGYQRLIGSLLWAVRHVYPQCAYGCSQLCKLMSAPTDLAWLCALHMPL
jgi:hypothetical protein